MKIHRIPAASFAIAWLPLIVLCAAVTGLAGERHQAVLDLGPAGYWPADEGAETVLHDLSPTANDGVIQHVPWDRERNLLDFTGAYQWLEIPKHKAYQTSAFSMGGWVFLRSELIGSGWVNRQGMLLIGNRHWLNAIGVQLCIRRQQVMEVVSDGREDVLGTRLYASWRDGKRVEWAYGKPDLPLGQWHHLLYTFAPDAEQPPSPEAANLARQATVTAANAGGHPSRAPGNTIDGDPDTEWLFWPDPGEDDAERWIQLDFPAETAINRIRLVGRSGRTDYFSSGALLFSDGTTIAVPSLMDGWDALFPTKKVTWVRYVGTTTVGTRPGLCEFQVYLEDRVVYEEEGVIENVVLGEGVIGTGTLYLNGEAVASADGVVYQPADANLQIGNDAYWWHQMIEKSGSLDGTVCDLVWFGRALSTKEVVRLYEATRPAATPDVDDDTVLVLDGNAVAVDDLASLPPAARRTALVLFGRKDKATLRQLTADVLPVLTATLDEPNCRLPTVQLLLKLEDDAANAVLEKARSGLIAVVKDGQAPENERADAALALAAMGEAAAAAAPMLADELDKLVSCDRARPPRVEELLRNALTCALLDIAPENAQVREVLARTFAAPMMQALDLDSPALAGEARADALRSLIDAGRYLEAMALYPKLHQDAREYFFTYKAAQDRDYTATAHFNGATYKVGTGIAWQGVEKIPEDEYRAIVAKVVGEYPVARDWRPTDYEHLYRVPITRIDAKGREQKVYLEGKDFVLDGHDAKCRAWSIFVDELGYIHVMGGQHNVPNSDLYIPGSWERMGVSRNRNSDDYPQQMYWVSTEPESIDAFKFAGQRRNPRAIPAGYLNYLCFVQSPSSETYLYGRAEAFGWQCWGMFRHDAAAKRWTPVGGDPYDIIASARRHNPDWIHYLHDPVRGTVPKDRSDVRRLVWAWQPPFYQFCRDGWGVRFDKTGRMHVRMTISGLDGAGYVRPTSVYAWSDDRGETFHRADGSPVKLPLTVNPAPEHNAEIDVDNTLQHHHGGQYATRQWWELWLGLIKKAGWRV